MKIFFKILLILIVVLFNIVLATKTYATSEHSVNYEKLNEYEKIIYDSLYEHRNDLKPGSDPIGFKEIFTDLFEEEGDFWAGMLLNEYVKNVEGALQKDYGLYYNGLKVWGDSYIVFIGYAGGNTGSEEDSEEDSEEEAEKVEIENEKDVLNLDKYFYKQLNSYEKMIYSNIYLKKEQLKYGVCKINLVKYKYSYKNTMKYIDRAIDAFERDNPEIFYIASKSISVGDEGVYITLTSGFNTLEEANNAIGQIEETKNNVLKTLSGSTSSKAWKIHDYLLEKKEKEIINSSSFSDTMYEGIMRKSSSKGYSLAFKYLANAAGIECEIMKGKYKEYDWVWNVMNIDGTWYIGDVACDGRVTFSDSYGNTNYVSWYFMNTLHDCLLDHTLDIDTSEFEYPTIKRYKIKEQYQEYGNLVYMNVIDEDRENVKWIVGIQEDNQETVTIPSKINDEDVTIICGYTFALCKNLKNVVIPENVIEISNNAFKWCKSLEQITIPKSVVTIGEDVFKDCKEKVTLNVYSNSKALEYAKEKNLKYHIIDQQEQVPEPTPQPQPTNNNKIGDIDGDNEITSFDAYTALELSLSSDNLTKEQINSLDIDKDGEVTSYDAYLILSYSVGIIDSNYWK